MIIKDTKFKRIQLMASHGIPIYPKTLTTAVWDFDRNKSLSLILDELNPVKETKVEVVDLLGGGDLTDTLSFELTNEYVDGSGYYIDENGSKRSITPIQIFGRDEVGPMYSASFISLPDGVEFIDDFSFMGLYKVTGLILPSTLIGIGGSVFDLNTNLEYIEIRAPRFVGIGGFMSSGTIPNIQLRVPSNLVNEYKNHEFWELMHKGNVVALLDYTSTGDVNTIYYEGKPFYPTTKTDRVIHNDGRTLSDMLDANESDIIYHYKYESNDSRQVSWQAVPEIDNYEIIINIPLCEMVSDAIATLGIVGEGIKVHSESIKNDGTRVINGNQFGQMFCLSPEINSSQSGFNALTLLARIKLHTKSDGSGGIMECTSILSNRDYQYIFEEQYSVVTKTYCHSMPNFSGEIYRIGIDGLYGFRDYTGAEITIYKTSEERKRPPLPPDGVGYWKPYNMNGINILNLGDPGFNGTIWTGKNDEDENVEASVYAEEIRFPEGTTVIAKNSFPLSYTKKMILPSTIKRIEDNAIYVGADLEINFPEGLEYIGAQSIGGDLSNTLIIPSTVKEIGLYAFKSYDHDIDLFFANPSESKLEKIGEFAFQGFSQIKSLYLPDNVKHIGKFAFAGYIEMIALRLPPNLETIGEYAFTGCMALNRLSIPSKVKEIPLSCFSEADLSGGLDLNEGLEIIGPTAFNLNSLHTLEFPSTLKQIKAGAFARSQNLEELNFPDSLILIELDAFFESHSLSILRFGKNILTIESTAFGLCSKLSRIEITAVTPPTIGDNVFDTNGTGDLKIYVPAASLNAYKTAPKWVEYADRIFAL